MSANRSPSATIHATLPRSATTSTMATFAKAIAPELAAETLQKVPSARAQRSRESNSVIATWIGIPRNDGQEIADAASQTAPLADWGIQRLDTDTFLADPGRLMERLIPSILNLLADVQAALVVDLKGLAETPPPRRVRSPGRAGYLQSSWPRLPIRAGYGRGSRRRLGW